MTNIDLAGKRVVITGAATGLGRAFALAFASSGAVSVIADIDEKGLSETQELIKETGASVYACAVDVCSSESCAALAKYAQDKAGGVDALVNNAAMYGGLERKPFSDIDENVWDQVMSVNVKGVWQMTKAMLPLMKEAGSGSVINVASATVFSGSPEWMHYVASKGAVIAMTRVMAKEMGAHGIRANVIAPGFTLTDASHQLMDDAANYGVARAALGRNAEPDDIVGSALYLASDLSKFMTGQTLVVDGGKQFI